MSKLGLLGQRTLRATKWAAVIAAVMQAGRALLLFVLAGILGPDVFGLAARVLAVAMILDFASEFGLTAALVQREDLTERHLDTAFWSNLIFAFLISVIGVATVEMIAWLTGPSEFLDTLPFVLAVPIVLACGNVPRSLLMRNLDYQPIARATLMGTLAYVGLSVGLALAGAGVWAVLIGFYANHAVIASVLWISSGWRPRRAWGVEEFRDLARFGIFKALSKTLESLTNGIDVLIIGGVLGNAAAGIYMLAKRVGGMLVAQIAGAIDSVLFSSFSRMQTEPARMANAFLRATRVLAVTTSTALIATVAGVTLLPLILGATWESVVPIARLLSAWGFVVAIGGTLFHPVLNGLGRSWGPFVVDLVRVVALSAMLAWWSPWGLVWASLAVLIQMILAAAFAQLLVLRALRISARSFLAQILDASLAFVPIALAIPWFESLLPTGEVWRVVGACVIGLLASALHAGIIHLADRQAWPDVLSLVSGVVGRRRRGPVEEAN